MFESKIIIITLLAQINIQVSCQDLESPCPNIFEYQLDRNTNQLYGEVQVASTDSNIMLVNIELSVGNPVRGYNGMIELGKPKKEVINDVIYKRPIIYKVFFPRWHRLPPKVTKILVNGNLVCSGPKIPIDSAPVITTINLQHTLRIDYQPLSYPNHPPSDNFIPGDTNIPFFDEREPPRDRRPPFPHRRPPFTDEIPPLPNSDSPTGYAPKFGNNQYSFNPVPKRGPPLNNINFRPQMPKDPSKIYSGNPFFASSTSRPLGGNQPVDILPSEIPPSATTSSRFDFVDNTDVILSGITGTSARFAYHDVCGRSVATNSLVVHGQSVPVGAYPWLAALFAVRDTGLNYLCSASLVSDRHVVTAAHCVRRENRKLRPKDLIVILGKLNIQRWTQSDGGKMIDPESIHEHPDYQPLSSDADIAVLTLSERLQFTKLIRPICLWSSESNILDLVVGQAGTVVGWGKDENGDLITAEPKQIKLPIVSQETCLRSSYTFADITSNRTFCAGYRNGSGPCNGDSGSGFIMKRGDRWLLKGIVSMSISDTQKFTCDLINYVVFTDASKFVSWLLSFIK